jgi:hypothetical protein
VKVERKGLERNKHRIYVLTHWKESGRKLRMKLPPPRKRGGKASGARYK